MIARWAGHAVMALNNDPEKVINQYMFITTSMGDGMSFSSTMRLITRNMSLFFISGMSL